MLHYPPLIKIAIIGGGPSGVSLCLQLTQYFNAIRPKTKISLILFEKNADIGFGLPYALNEETFCINLPKEHMLLVPGEAHHFATWLTNTQPIESTPFPPRHYFGRYTKERIFTIQSDDALEIITRTEHEVFDVLVDECNQYQIHTRHKGKETICPVDYVILATGHLPNTLFPQLHQFSEYHPNPWDLQTYQTLPTHAHVGIIGTRLTAIDVALKLHQQQHQGKITMMSRWGLLSAVRGTHPAPKMLYLTPNNIQKMVQQSNSIPLLRRLLGLFEQEIKPYLPQTSDLQGSINLIKTLAPAERIRLEIHQAELGHTAWQSVLSCFYQIIFRVWPKLPPAQQRYFLKRHAGLMLTFLCSFPLDKAHVIQSMMSTQQLSIQNRLVNIEKEIAHFSIQLEQGKSIQCDHLILAVGSGNALEAMPLLANMMNRQLIQKHRSGGICINPKTCQVITQSPIATQRIYTLGELTKGTCFKMIELGQVVEQAQIIAHHLIKQIASTTFS